MRSASVLKHEVGSIVSLAMGYLNGKTIKSKVTDKQFDAITEGFEEKLKDLIFQFAIDAREEALEEALKIAIKQSTRIK